MINHRAHHPARLACALIVFSLAATPAFAVNKDMVQLQTQVRDLQDAVAHLQQSNDERMGVLRDLVQQTADSVNKMSLTVEGLQQKMSTQQEASSGKMDQVSSQVQSINDSLDELKARLNAMEKALQSVQGQQQSINAALQNIAPAPGTGLAPGSSAPQSAGPAGPNVPPTQPVADNGNVPPDNPFPAHQGPQPSGSAPNGAAPVGDLYKTALSDFMAAKYVLATSEFGDVIKSYPDDPLAGNSYYYLGEIEYRAGRFASAIKNYDHVVQQFPGNPKVPVSRLHKGSALLALKQREAGIAEMRALIQRYPSSPEAAQARTKLNGMGVSTGSRRPS
jgi:tol-pal system protein YbgF